MKKILIFIVLSILILQNQVFAIIQKVPENAVLQQAKPHLSSKQKIFTYLIQRKIRRFNAECANPLQECLTITLKNGRIISATIVSMDDKNIIYKRCDQSSLAEETVQVDKVAFVTDAQNRIIFNNPSKAQPSGALTKGDENAKASISFLLMSVASGVVGFMLELTNLFNTESKLSVLIEIALGLILIVGIILSFAKGVNSLSQMSKTPPQKKSSRPLATIATIISGLALLLMLIPLVLVIVGAN